MTNKIKVEAVPGRMLINLEKLNVGITEYIGYTNGEMNNIPVLVEDNNYYRRALKNGDLALHVAEKKEKLNKTI